MSAGQTLDIVQLRWLVVGGTIRDSALAPTSRNDRAVRKREVESGGRERGRERGEEKGRERERERDRWRKREVMPGAQRTSQLHVVYILQALFLAV